MIAIVLTNEVPKFPPGRVVITQGANASITEGDFAMALSRHLRGDWGECSPQTKERNDLALKNGGQLLSVYTSTAGETFWIITEWDRSATTILLPDEY